MTNLAFEWRLQVYNIFWDCISFSSFAYNFCAFKVTPPNIKCYYLASTSRRVNLKWFWMVATWLLEPKSIPNKVDLPARNQLYRFHCRPLSCLNFPWLELLHQFWRVDIDFSDDSKIFSIILMNPLFWFVSYMNLYLMVEGLNDDKGDYGQWDGTLAICKKLLLIMMKKVAYLLSIGCHSGYYINLQC